MDETPKGSFLFRRKNKNPIAIPGRHTGPAPYCAVRWKHLHQNTDFRFYGACHAAAWHRVLSSIFSLRSKDFHTAPWRGSFSEGRLRLQRSLPYRTASVSAPGVQAR